MVISGRGFSSLCPDLDGEVNHEEVGASQEPPCLGKGDAITTFVTVDM